MDASSDILGGRLPVSSRGSPETWLFGSQFSIFLTMVALLFILFGFVPVVRVWRDGRYRKGLRRRYGIPDDDLRPFNVAFAAAHARAKEERAKREDVRSKRGDDHPQPPQPTPPYTPPRDHNALRQRRNHVSGGDVSDLPAPDGIPPTADRFVPEYRTQARIDSPMSVFLPGGFSPLQPKNAASIPSSAPAGQQDRTHVHNIGAQGTYAREGDQEKAARMTRADKEAEVNGPALNDQLADDMDVDENVTVLPKRGAKRTANREDDDSIEATRVVGREKRARKISIDSAIELQDEDMADEDRDADVTVEQIHRGKKRDRAEAGSSFGGDESLPDEDDEERKTRRHRKRRTMKKPDTGARGQKRGREAEAEESEDQSDRPKRRDTRKKRGKTDTEAADISLRLLCPLILCAKEDELEKWEANGVRYKVGPNGQRLRQELVKKSRSRFPMPKDSHHPDRQANIDVYVEKWLSEEEYQEAKEQHELAWQDTLDDISEPATPGDVPDSPSRADAGKNLLYVSTLGQKDTPAPQKGSFRQSIATNVGLRLNPFQQSAGPGRRVTSMYFVPLPATPESPKLRSARSYSKWEKQDLEAAAMSKLREKQLEAARAAEAKKAASVPPAQFTAPSTPTIGNPAEKPPQKNDNKTAVPSIFGVPPAGTATPPMLNVPPNMPSLTPAASISATSEARKAPPLFGVTSAPAPAPPAQNNATAPSMFAFGATPAATSTSQPGTLPRAAQLARGTQQQPNFVPQPSTPSIAFGSNPASSTPAASTTPALSIFGAAGASAQPASAANANTAQKSAFFAAPSSAAPGALGATQAGSNKLEQALFGQSTSSGPSLLSRLGPQPSSQPATTNPSSSSMFSSAKPNMFASNAAPSGSTSGPSMGVTATAAPAPNASAPDMPKFNFGVSLKPSNPTSTFTPMVTSPPAQTSVDTSKPISGFGASNPSTFPVPVAPTASSTAPSSTAPAPKFTFAPSYLNPAASSNPFGFGANISTPNAAFGSAPNTFSTTPASSPATGSVFGTVNTAKPTDAPKFAFGSSPFGTAPVFGSGAYSSTPAGQTNVPPQTVFGAPSSSAPSTSAGMGTTTTATNSEPQKAELKFNFGGGPSSSSGTTTSAFTAQPTATPSPFGNPPNPNPNPTPSAFGFGNPSSTSGGTQNWQK